MQLLSGEVDVLSDPVRINGDRLSAIELLLLRTSRKLLEEPTMNRHEQSQRFLALP